MSQDKLTPEQEAKIPAYIDEALKNAYKTDTLDREAAKQAIFDIYDFKGKERPLVVFVASPLEAQKKVKILQEQFPDRQSISELELARTLKQHQEPKEFVYSYQWYCFWSWIGYYTYFKFLRNEVYPEKKDEYPDLDRFLDWSTKLHYIQDAGNVCFISDRPSVINVLKDGNLHCETGPALAYRDGFECYVLNGIKVPKEIVMTPANELDANLIATTQNAEVRREIFRKIGSENVVRKLNGKCLDKKTITIASTQVESVFAKAANDYTYELWEVDLGRGNLHPFLKMSNPSIEAEHFEPVLKGTKTVLEALSFRNDLGGVFVPPSILT